MGKRPSIDPATPAIEVFTGAFGRLADTIEENVDGTLSGSDPDALHDLRVAVRRTRALLKAAKPLLPKDVRRHHAAELKWLGHASSPVRDLDVSLAGLDELAQLLDEPGQVEHVRSMLEKRRAAAQADLEEALGSERFAVLLPAWRDELDRQSGSGKTAGKAAVKMLDKAWWKVERRAAVLAQDSPADDVHDLRKRCKELRYLLELFTPMYAKGRLDRVIRALKKLQKTLGAFQDAEVLRGLLEECRAESGKAKAKGEDTSLAVLDAVLERRQAAAREALDDRWDRLAREVARLQWAP